MAASSVARSLDRKSSIETEPRTLHNQQILFAREAALYVMSTKTIEEALQIFTKGLEPVMSPTTREENQQTENEFISMEIEGDDDSDEDELDVEDEFSYITDNEN